MRKESLMRQRKGIACDRCHRMKLKCCKGDPCDRCLALKIPCTYKRTAKKIGRPKSKKEFGMDKKSNLDLFLPKEPNNELLRPPHMTIPNSYSTVMEGAVNNSAECKNSNNQQGTHNKLPISAYMSAFESLGSLPNSGNSDFETFLGCFNGEPSCHNLAFCGSERSMDDSPLSVLPKVSEIKLPNCQLCEENGLITDYIKINHEENFLISYFTNEVCSLLFAEPTRTEFKDLIIPLCLDFEPIKFPVIAISCNRIYFSQVEQDTVFNKDNSSTLKPLIRNRIYYKSIAETLIIEDNKFYENHSRECYVAFICLILLDILEGDSMRWKAYLKKVFSLLEEEGGLSTYIEKDGLVGKIILYLDIITSFTNSAGSCISGRYNLENDVHFNSHSLKTLGIINRLKLQSAFNQFDMMYFERVANLSSLSNLKKTIYQLKKKIENESLYLLKEEKDNLISEQELLKKKFSDLSNVVENDIQVEHDFGLPDFSLDQEQQQQRYMIAALRWSSYIRLHQIIFGSGQKHCWRVRHSLKSLILYLKLLELEKIENKKILFPLIIAASVTIDAEDKIIIMEIMKESTELFRFGCLCHVKNMIERMWQDNKIYDNEHNFDRIHYYEYPGLVIL